MRQPHKSLACNPGRNTLRSLRRLQLEILEGRFLLAGELVAQWRADDLTDSFQNGQVVDAWYDNVNRIAAERRGTPILIEHAIGGLDNRSEVITLLGDSIVIHQFAYSDAWYRATDGRGSSLELIDPQSAARESWQLPASWRPSSVSGGTPGRGAANLAGDANRDGRFDSSDLVLVFQAGEYEDAIPGNSTWNEGDWNGDGDFTTADLVLAFREGNYVVDAIADLAMARAELGTPLMNTG